MFPSIANPPDSFNIVLSGHTLQFLTDFTDMFFHYAAVPGSIQPPHGFIDPFPVKDLPGMGQKKLQNIM